jgi:hypothetical protein
MAANRLTAFQTAFVLPRGIGGQTRRTHRRLHQTASPESWFITLSVREADAVSPGEIEIAARAVTDWGGLVQVAVRHRVAAYVLESVTRASLDLPPQAAQLLRAATLGTVVGSARIDQEMRRVVGAMHARHVPALVLKGPALVRTIYARPALRPYGDLDLTVQDQHESIAEETLLAQGYNEIDYDAEVRREHAGHVHEGAAFHRQFTSADEQVLIELHIDPLQLGLRPTCEADRWRRVMPVPNLPGAVMLCPEDQVVHLSAHVHKHGFDRLIWLKDLDMLLRTYRESVDWALVERTAQAEGVRGSVWYSLYLAALLLDAPLPPGVLERLRPAWAVRRLYQWVWPVERIVGLNGFMRRRSVQFHAADSWRGMLPSLVLMGRRADRLRAAAGATLGLR